jgi:hypothetical protein
VKTKPNTKETTMHADDDFTDRFGHDYRRPSEAAEALLDDRDNLPDPRLILASTYALREMATRLADALDEPYALYSPQQAADFLAYASAALDELARAAVKIPNVLEDMRTRGDIAPGHDAHIAQAQATLGDLTCYHRADSQTPGLTQALETAARHLDAAAKGYTGFDDPGDSEYVYALAAELAGRPGVEVAAVHEPGPHEDADRVLASVDFTAGTRECCLVFDLGWEVEIRVGGDGRRNLGIRGAFGSSVHPAAIVDEALAAIEGESAADGA